MAEPAKRSLIGNYALIPEGKADQVPTHMVLTVGEYSKLCQERDQAVREANDTRESANREIQRERNAAANRVRQAEEAAEQRIQEIEKALAAEKQESAYQRGLNVNLLRIAKERANADRKLKPKKEHTGYVVLMSAEKEYKYKVDRRNWKIVILWETVLQTPYSIDLTEEQVRRQMYELFQKYEDNEWLIERLGINANYNGNYEEMLEKSGWAEKEIAKHNVMLTRKMKANYKTGYWELTFLHTKALGPIPKDMRAC